LAQRVIGVLLTAYGTPESLDDVEEYLTHIRQHYTYIKGDKKPTPEMVQDLQDRYRAVGGRSPLTEITRRQAKGLEEALNATGGDVRFKTYIGMKHWRPFIQEAVDQIVRDGITRLVGLALTPQYSRMSVGAYRSEVEQALEKSGAPVDLTFIEFWHDRPEFLDILAERIKKAREQLPEEAREGAPVIFTAHSLPARIREWNDPYPRHLEETARGASERAGVERWFVAWQSKGATPVAWLEPTLEEVLEQVAGEGGKAVIVCPAGFVADHLEVLYDIDIEAKALASKLGLALVRTESLNDDPAFISALAKVVTDHLQEARSAR